MGEDLSWHVPSASARRRAESAGLDLDEVKRHDPTTYKMVCALPVMWVDTALEDAAQDPLQAALPDQQLFQARQDDRIVVLAFPGPDAAELELLDRTMGDVVEEHLDRYAYYRVVRDLAGTSREFGLPTNPDDWTGGQTMVGPFANQGEADSWGRDNVMGRDRLTFDSVPYAGAWFCDVFSADL